MQQQAVITWEAGLIRTIQDLTALPCRWFDIDDDGGKASIAGCLIVRQSRRGHEQVVAVLEQLEMAADDAAEEQGR